MQAADQFLVDLYRANRDAGLHPIDRLDEQPDTLPAFDRLLTEISLIMNCNDASTTNDNNIQG